MSAVLSAHGLGKRYRRQWALKDCTLEVPAGRVTGLVGPNGAGKTTLLNLAAGMLAPTTGSIEVCGGRPAAGQDQLAKVGYVAQDTPLYAGLSVDDHLRLGARLNARRDAAAARSRVGGPGADGGAGGKSALFACLSQLDALGYRQQVTYLSASRFWALQWAETGLFLGLSGLLAAFCFWQVRRV